MVPGNGTSFLTHFAMKKLLYCFFVRVKGIKIKTKRMNTQSQVGLRPRSPSANIQPAATPITLTM